MEVGQLTKDMTNALHDLTDFLDQRFADRPNDEIPDAEILDALLEWIDSRAWPTFSITYYADGTITRIDHAGEVGRRRADEI